MTQTPTSAEEALATATNEASLARSIARSAQIEADLAVNPGRYRMLTGVRPTGHMHLGHYFGTMHSWQAIQDAGVETWILVADYQVITDRDSVGPIRERVLSLVADTLAVGVDPRRSTIFAHSGVAAANQLMLPFLSLVTESELHRNPTVKAELEATDGRAMTGLMLTYPVHQAADILFCQANLVPVGKDQLPHLEQARLIAQRFDKRYGRAVEDHPVFRRPEALLSEAPLLLGLDGEKMSKSRRNTIELRMSADETAKLLRKAKTDSERVITYDPAARPEVSNLLMLASLCGAGAPEQIAESIGDGGAGALKALVTEAVNEFFAPIRARRAELVADEGHLSQVLAQGTQRAREVAQATLDDVRTAMGMDYA
ncbi:tryptophan--tRNA ligase [Actinomyces bowdenii]|uniref:Tryptophan--tRNA ligase n=1 Tax=Actinomyces capricornis TaxID=2755559 RepID=A0ABM7UER0_9ACTO|nr:MULTISPECIES: tryptophan--tRNA ligase [Actinomyces]MCR2051640.1 tryptophan--tRNA ligase [Actinomyces bowdenii]MDO5063736.1 tryptophan--tRNA ligase [Actinomyces bowdenii]BDA63495.1 tryptophan--tRNA ligase [Actinomyces capricornis]